MIRQINVTLSAKEAESIITMLEAQGLQHFETYTTLRATLAHKRQVQEQDIRELELTVRTIQDLRKARIDTIKQLVALTRPQLDALKLTRRSWREVNEVITNIQEQV